MEVAPSRLPSHYPEPGVLGAARLGPAGPGVASAADSKPGRRGGALPHRCRDPGEKGVKENAPPRGRGKYFLLTPRTLGGFGPARLPTPCRCPEAPGAEEAATSADGRPGG